MFGARTLLLQTHHNVTCKPIMSQFLPQTLRVSLVKINRSQEAFFCNSIKLANQSLKWAVLDLKMAVLDLNELSQGAELEAGL